MNGLIHVKNTAFLPVEDTETFCLIVCLFIYMIALGLHGIRLKNQYPFTSLETQTVWEECLSHNLMFFLSICQKGLRKHKDKLT